MTEPNTKELRGDELLAYWRNRAKEASDREVNEMLRRSRFQDALAEIEAMAPKGSPIERVAARALGFPNTSNTPEEDDMLREQTQYMDLNPIEDEQEDTEE